MPVVHSADGTAIAFDRVGSGPTVILVDGAFASRSLMPTAEGLARQLADSFTVISYDRRGRGESSPVLPHSAAAEATAAESVAAEIADLDALIGTVDGPPALCGFSSGAVLALEAARAGSAVSRLVLQEPPFVVDASRRPVPPDYPQQLDSSLGAGRRGDAVALFMTHTVDTPAEIVDGLRDHEMWPGLEQAAHTLPYDAAIMRSTMTGDPTALDRYAQVTTPTLVLYGDKSEPWLANASHKLADVLPHARLETLPGQDHMVTAEAMTPPVSRFCG